MAYRRRRSFRSRRSFRRPFARSFTRRRRSFSRRRSVRRGPMRIGFRM